MSRFLSSITLLIATGLGSAAQAQLSANLGFNSDYVFRGIPQATSSAFGGVDYESSGWYAGTWAADVKDGLEVDLYGGYGGEAGDFTYGIGFTGYFYTGDFDDTYKEINLSGGYSLFSLDVAIGEYDNFGGPTLDYQVYELGVAYENVYFKIGVFGDDFDGNWYEAGISHSLEGFDLGLSLVHGDDDLLGDSDSTLIFTVSRTFGLFDGGGE